MLGGLTRDRCFSADESSDDRRALCCLCLCLSSAAWGGGGATGVVSGEQGGDGEGVAGVSEAVVRPW